MKHAKTVLLANVILALASATFADTIIFRTDTGTTRAVEGEIVRLPQGWEVRVSREGGGVRMILEPDRLIKVIPAPKPPTVEDLAVRIEKNPRAVMDEMLDLWRKKPEQRAEAAKVFQRALQAYLRRAEGLGRSLAFEESLQSYGEAGKMLRTADGRAILTSATLVQQYLRQIDEATTRTRRAYSAHLAERANEILDREDAARAEQALLDLEKARTLDETNAAAWLGLARHHYRVGSKDVKRVETAIFAASMAEKHARDPVLLADARALFRMAVRANQELTGQTEPPPTLPKAPTPAPPRRPLVTPPTGPVAPVITPAPAGTPIPTPITAPLVGYIERVKSVDRAAVKGLFRRILQGEHLEFVIGIPAFIVVFWLIPRSILRRRSRKADVVAGNWGRRVLYLGILALLGYVIGSIRVPRRGGRRCPNCRRAIDDVEHYKDFNFSLCPHCGESIAPVFDLDELVHRFVEQVEREVQRGRGQYSGRVGEKDPTVRLMRALLIGGIRARASDLYLDTSSEGATVRRRVDGVTYEALFLPASAVPSFVSALKVMAGLDIGERRVPQNGRFKLIVDKTDVEVRINTLPQPHGEKVNIRLLNKRTIEIGAAQLGMEGRNLVLFEQAIHRPNGLILVSGPSDSGKTTTLYVALRTIHAGGKNIATLEDPIEYELPGLNQMQINPEAGFTFAGGLHTILRQNPDVIMVGELRDRETAVMAIDAAASGHLFLAALPATDATAVLTRLGDMGLEPRRYAAALVLSIAQRLARLTCAECRKSYEPDPKDLAALDLDRDGDKAVPLFKGQGCPRCQHTGFFGRTGLFEVFSPDDDLRSLLEKNTAVPTIREAARSKGMTDLRQAGVAKILRGLTTVEEVLRTTL